MGVDAEMFLRFNREVSDQEITSWSREMCERFGHGKFWIDRDRGRHALSRVDVYEQDGPTIEPGIGETFVRVWLWGRYYGPGYERGDLPFILNVAQWLQETTGGAVWYGGDSSGICAEELTSVRRAALWTHFREHGHKPYVGYFDRDDRDGYGSVRCDLCDWEMNRHGFGRDYAAYYCAGCGHKQITRDGGETWSDTGDFDDQRKRRNRAAPEMLEALREALPLCTHAMHLLQGEAALDRAAECVGRIAQAIESATGQEVSP